MAVFMHAKRDHVCCPNVDSYIVIGRAQYISPVDDNCLYLEEYATRIAHSEAMHKV